MSAKLLQLEKPKSNTAGFVHLSIVYVVWGSTYLAIRVAVREGAGFTPFMMGAMRVMAAGAILLLMGLLTRQRLKLKAKELLTLFGSGLLLWCGGNGLVMMGEQHADSAVAALTIASTPIWVAIIESIIDQKMPSLLLISALLVGTAGVVVLSMPLILSGLRAEIISVVVLVLGALSWSLGTIFQSRNQVSLAPVVSSGYQSLFGGVGFIIMALIFKEPLPHPVFQAWVAWGYLVIFGSILAFTSFVQVLKLLPVNIVTTYSYVNPIIAVILGWIILRESITYWTIGGSILILLGVTGVFRAHARDRVLH